MEASSRDREKVLGSWKEIAAYLGKGVRTVQRWEQQFKLPVRRPEGAPKGVVTASPDELDRWLAIYWARRIAPADGNGAHKDLDTALRASRDLCRANQQLLEELFLNLQGLKQQCASMTQALKEAREREREREMKRLERRAEKTRTRRK